MIIDISADELIIVCQHFQKVFSADPKDVRAMYSGHFEDTPNIKVSVYEKQTKDQSDSRPA